MLVKTSAEVLDLSIGVEPVGFASDLEARQWLAATGHATSTADAGAQPVAIMVASS